MKAVQASNAAGCLSRAVKFQFYGGPGKTEKEILKNHKLAKTEKL